jgi:hypothetical protein
MGNIVDASMLNQELKFMKLSNDYQYGKYEDEEMEYKYREKDDLYVLEELQAEEKSITGKDQSQSFPLILAKFR